MIFSIWTYLAFALTPSLLWLIYYLRKDAHPEPNWMIVKGFLFGALSVIPTLALQIFFNLTVGQFLIIFALLSVASEELMKYLSVRWGIFPSTEVDEPTDVMLYLVIAGLGFAAVENFFYLMNPENIQLTQVAVMAVVRFISATLIHALSSGLLGYFIAKKYFLTGKRFSGKGFLLAFGLHSLYNLSIMLADHLIAEPTFAQILIIISVIPIGLIILNVYGFKDLKKINFK